MEKSITLPLPARPQNQEDVAIRENIFTLVSRKKISVDPKEVLVDIHILLIPLVELELHYLMLVMPPIQKAFENVLYVKHGKKDGSAHLVESPSRRRGNKRN